MKSLVPERDLVGSALAVLTPRDRRLYKLAVLLRILLSFFDLFGVLLLGTVGYLLAATATGGPVPPVVARVLELLGIEAVPTTETVLILGGVAAAALIAQSVLALYIQARLLRFLGTRAGITGDSLSRRFLKLPLLEVRKYPSQTTAYALLEGVNGLILGLLNYLMVIVGEVSLLLVLALALLVVDPLTTVVAVVYFGFFAWLLNRRLGALARLSGTQATNAIIAARTVTHDAIDTYPEITVMNRREQFATSFGYQRRGYAGAQANFLMLSAIPRYGMEAAMVLGAVLLTVILLLTRDTASAVGSLVLFLAAASRIVPSLLRLNAAVLGMRSQAMAAEKAANLAHQIQRAEETQGSVNEAALGLKGTIQTSPVEQTANNSHPAEVQLTGVSLTYPGRDQAALRNINLTVKAGDSLALAGTSGAGKSSLVTVLLGLVVPTTGTVLIGGVPPRRLIETLPGALGYVPQDVALVFGTIRDNVALGLPRDEIDDQRVWDALERAHLDSFVRRLPKSLDSVVGERGVRISGGQRQRLGLARALYIPPQMLVLDEATSALDAETERAISATVASLGGLTTTVTVAHRLATIRNSDQVAFLEDGEIVAQGSFEYVRSAVPGFDRQAKLLGL